MSKTFDALCYVRIFSDEGKKIINKSRWTVISVRNENGFNYVSKRIYCTSGNIGITIDGICKEYGDEIFDLYKNGDECQVYVWLKRGGRIEKLNSVEITSRSMRFLSKVDASICFSADPGFPEFLAELR